MVDEGAPLARPFQGKQLLGALGGRSITSNEASRRSLMKQAQRNQFPIYIANDQDIQDSSHDNGCAASPSSLSCSATSKHILRDLRPTACWLLSQQHPILVSMTSPRRCPLHNLGRGESHGMSGWQRAQHRSRLLSASSKFSTKYRAPDVRHMPKPSAASFRAATM